MPKVDCRGQGFIVASFSQLGKAVYLTTDVGSLLRKKFFSCLSKCRTWLTFISKHRSYRWPWHHSLIKQSIARELPLEKENLGLMTAVEVTVQESTRNPELWARSLL